MQIEIDKDMVAKAIFDSLKPEERDALLSNAIKSAFQEVEKDKTRLQMIYESAAEQVAAKAIREEMQKPGIQKRFAQLAQDVILRAIDPDNDTYPNMVDKLACYFIAAINKGNQY